MLGALNDMMTGYLSAGAQLTVGVIVVGGALLVIGHALWGRR